MGGTSVLDGARAVADVARANADDTERGRRLAGPVVVAIEASGLAGMLAPTALGGTVDDPREAFEVIEEISLADASTGWCCSIGMGSNHLASLVPPATAGELFGDLRRGGAGAFAPGSLAVAGPAGVHVGGRWTYASNCQQAGVLAVGVVLCDGAVPRIGPGGVELGLAFLTADDITVDECWDMDGLRGTGSHDVIAELDLDPDRVSSLWAEKWPSEAVFRLRTFDVLGPALAMVPLAIGRAALDVLRERTQRDAAAEPRPGPRPRLADDPVAQLRVGEAEITLRAARTFLFDLVEQAMETAGRGDPPSRETSALIGLGCGEALRASRAVVQTVTELLGSAATRDGSPMLRLRRDIAAAGTHIMFSHHVQTGLGRELAGLPTSAFPFLPGDDA